MRPRPVIPTGRLWLPDVFGFTLTGIHVLKKMELGFAQGWENIEALMVQAFKAVQLLKEEGQKDGVLNMLWKDVAQISNELSNMYSSKRKGRTYSNRVQ